MITQAFDETIWEYTGITFNFKKVDPGLRDRLVLGICAPVASITCAIDTIIGLSAGLGSMLPLGENRPSHAFVAKQLEFAEYILRVPHMICLDVLNPKNEFKPIKGQYTRLTQRLSAPYTYNRGDTYIDDFIKSGQFLKKHVATRLSYGLLAVSISIVAAVQMIFAIPLTILSIVTMGKSKFITDHADKCLSSVGVIQDLYEIGRKIINPQIDLT